jgi:hypothetical protein
VKCNSRRLLPERRGFFYVGNARTSGEFASRSAGTERALPPVSLAGLQSTSSSHRPVTLSDKGVAGFLLSEVLEAHGLLGIAALLIRRPQVALLTRFFPVSGSAKRFYWGKGYSDQDPESASLEWLEIAAHLRQAKHDDRNHRCNEQDVNDAARGLDASMAHNALRGVLALKFPRQKRAI